jgi:hypothetical protein
MSRSTVEMLDIKKTPEIYPMTSMQETLEYFHDKLKDLNARAYEASAAIQKLGEQVQQLSSRAHKTKASVEQAQQTVQEGVERSAQKPEQAPYLLSTMYRRFSEQALLPEPLWGRLQAKFKPEREAEAEPAPVRGTEVELEAVQEAESDLESEEDVSPCLHRRLIREYKFEDELQAETVPELPPAPSQSLHFRRFSEQELDARGLRRPSLKMMPPDEMQDILDMAVTAASLRLDATPVFLG